MKHRILLLFLALFMPFVHLFMQKSYTKVDTMFNQGYLYYQNKDYTSAIPYFDSCIRLNPYSDDCLYMRAMIAMDQSDFVSAKSMLEASASIRPTEISTWVQLGICHIALKSYDTAEICFQRAIQINSKEAKVYSLWATNEYLRGDLEHAEDLYNTAILLDDSEPVYYIKRAEIKRKRGKNDEASKDIEKAHQLDPNSPLLLAYENANSDPWYKSGSFYALIIVFLSLFGFLIFRSRKLK